MKILGIGWAGTKTSNYTSTVAFFRDILEIKIYDQAEDVTVFKFPNGDFFEVIGPGEAPELGEGLKVDFLVESVDAAVEELQRKGVKLEGGVNRKPIQNWANYFSPDGNLFGFTDLFAHPLHGRFPEKILFYQPHEPYGFLGNWYPAPIFLKDKIWPTSEHYYQAQKMSGTPLEEVCRRLPSPRETFEMTRRPEVPIRADWEDVKTSVMSEAVKAKFSQNPELLELLCQTGDAELVENSPVDNFWGVGKDGDGQNVLGKLLMDIREQFKTHCRLLS